MVTRMHQLIMALSVACLASSLTSCATTAETLQNSISTRDAAAVERLLDRHESLATQPLPDGVSPLVAAITSDSASIVKLLLDRGANATEWCQDPDWSSSAMKTQPAKKAVETGNVEIVRLLLSHGVAPQSMLEYTVGYPLIPVNASIARELIAKGARLADLRAREDSMVARYADFNSNRITHGSTSDGVRFTRIRSQFDFDTRLFSIVDWRELRRADEVGEARGSVLLPPIERGSIEALRLLVELGADVNEVDSIGRTPYIAAAMWGDAEIMDVLASAGADVAATWRDQTARQWYENARRNCVRPGLINPRFEPRNP